MSKIGTIFGGGDDAADAAQQAASIQAQATREAADRQAETTKEQIAFQKESRDIARGDLQPFREAGQAALNPLQALVTDPNAQLSFIQDNPFFNALADRSTSTLLNNQAARGKVGSGGTAEALQSSLLLLGNDLLNQRIGQTQNLATLGQNAAAGQGTITQNTAANVGNLAQTGVAAQNDLITSGAAAQAAGIVGAANARTQSGNSLLNLIGGIGGNIIGAAPGLFDSLSISGKGALTAGIAACDVRVKENIQRIGHTNSGLPLYIFNYIGDNEPRINVMAQDVEKVMPNAVIEINGVKHVKMNEVYNAN